MEAVMMKLHILNELPPGILETDPDRLDTLLPGPTLIRLQGKTDPPLFIATLLHGNEPTGFWALQHLLKNYRREGRTLPRSLFIFLGNIQAAKYNERRLQDQPDFNRIWAEGDLPEHQLAQQVIREVTADGIFAAIDVHNSSGRNPHYACVNRVEPAHVNLGKLFSRTLVYFKEPHEVLSNALAEYGPSISVEAGQPHDPSGVRHVADFLDRCLQLAAISDSDGDRDDFDLYHCVACIRVPHNSRIGFHHNCGAVDFCFLKNLDSLNFSEVPENSLLGWRFNAKMHLSVQDEEGREMEAHFLRYNGTEIRFKRNVVPSLFTTDERIVHQDCLGYLMERYQLPSVSPAK